MGNIILSDMKYIYSSCNEWEMLKNKTILVTGAYGMLASYIVYFLIYLNETFELNIKILLMVRNESKAKEKFLPWKDKTYIEFLMADICDNIHIKGDLHFIIHAASPASSQFYGTDPIGVIKPNIFGTYNLLQLAYDKKIESMLYFSSCEIYGRTTINIVSEADTGVLDPIDLRSCYGESKRMGENMCISFFHQKSVPVKIVRPAHTYGPTMDIIGDKRVFAEFTKNIVYGENIVMKSSGAVRRSFCYIADATAGFFKVLLNGTSGEAYNVTNTEETYSIKELADILVTLYKEMNLQVNVVKRPDCEAYMENTNLDYPIYSNDKLKKLGWNGKYNVRDGFKHTIESFWEKEKNENNQRPYPHI